MSSTKVITIWYRRDDNNVYQLNHIEDGFDLNRTSPTPKIPEHIKMWKNGKWAMQRAELVYRGPGVPDLVENTESLQVL